MAVDSSSVSSISAAAATARNLYRRAKVSGPDFAEISSVVRPLHAVLKHLRAEAEDPDSLLNASGQESSVYARQLTPIVEDTDFTLKQLDTILEKYGSSPGDHDDLENGRRDGGNSSGKRMEDRERDMIALIRTKLANQKTNIDIFLDTVQLHNPTRQHRPVDLERTDDKQMNAIKDKVDIVAARLFQRRARARASGDAAEESEEEMWQQFWAELVKEGFSSDVLRKHKEVLRAYIRELDSNGLLDGNPPSVRGLLDQRPPQGRGNSAYAPQEYVSYPVVPAYASRQPQPPPVAITPASYPSSARGEFTSPKEMVSPNMDNEKFPVGVKLERRQPEQRPNCGDARSPTRAGYNSHVPHNQNQQQRGPPPPPAKVPMQTSYERYSSDSSSDSGSTDSQQLALISTRDIMDLDQHIADDLNARMGGLYLSPAMMPPNYGVSPGTSPSGRYQPPPSIPLPLDHHLSSSPQSHDHLGVAPRYVPPMPAYGASSTSATMAPPPPYAPSVTQGAAPIPIPSSAPNTQSGLPPPTSAVGQQRYSRLAPDSKGSDIPLDAKWTRIKRALVSPEILTKAGVRYEARPDFVFILGVLTKGQIAEYARQSAEVRARRNDGYAGDRRRPVYYDEEKRNMDRKRSSRQQSDTDSDTDSEDVIWDDSDTSDSDSRDRSRASTNKYIPREYRRRRIRRDSNSSTFQEEPEVEDKENRKGHKAYPVIVDKASPTATIQPKPILKNRNSNHVRFEDGAPREVSPGELEREREQRERRERRRAEKGRDPDRRRRDRDRDHERNDRDRDRDRDRERERERDVRDKDKDRGEKDRERERDRHRERERERDRDYHPSNSRSHRDRDRDEARDRRRAKKSVWGETLGAVGIGGAAASLLSVLTEAAAGF